MQGLCIVRGPTPAIPYFNFQSSHCLIPGAPCQREADRRWSVMSDYVDKLPQDEKPKTFGSWTKVMKKCGYGVHEEYVLKINENTPCNFPGIAY